MQIAEFYNYFCLFLPNGILVSAFCFFFFNLFFYFRSFCSFCFLSFNYFFFNFAFFFLCFLFFFCHFIVYFLDCAFVPFVAPTPAFPCFTFPLVGANSPRRCTSVSSVISTGIKFLPL